MVEKNLANLVSEIRAAIGDDPSNPQVHSHRAPIWVRVSRDCRPAGGSGRSCLIRIKWLSGQVTLDEGEHVLGRDPDVEIYLDAPGVSRRHAVIRIAAAQATIEDLGSKNGTLVGDQRVDGSRSIGDGDVITVGSVKLSVRVLQTPGSTETEGPASARTRILPDA